MFFSHSTPVPPDAYNNSLFHAYLDGCSVVINHADWISADIAHLCLDLTKSIPHVYANTYLTPPSSQAVAPHADDRDVFVIQLIGKKHWKVYKTVPIPYPYRTEQVGKADLKVPKQVLKGPTVYDTVLEPGDVLYMPRGYVHEAHTLDECSFHVTIAMPTHDWTLAGAITAATHHALCQVVDYRMALPTSLFSDCNSSTNGDLEIVNQQLNQALQRVQQQVTIESIMNDLQTKTKHHNERANAKRMTIIQTQKQQVHNKNTSTPTTNIIGREAADSVTLTTRVRASTEQEKAQVKLSNEKPRGLHVRPETAEALMTILQRLKQNPGKSCRVQNLGDCLVQDSVETVSDMDSSYICQLTLLSFAKCCVELGGMVIDGSIDE